jgi:hypothetical protein
LGDQTLAEDRRAHGTAASFVSLTRDEILSMFAPAPEEWCEEAHVKAGRPLRTVLMDANGKAVTVLKWDEILPGQQDYLNLAPLPVSSRRVLFTNTFTNTLTILAAVVAVAIDVNQLVQLSRRALTEF